MEEIDIKDFIRFYFNKIIYVIVAIMVVVVGGNVYNIFFRVPMYQSSTTIVLAGQNSGVSSYAYTNMDYQLNRNLLSTYSSIIKSRQVLQSVIDGLNLNYTVNELSKNISVQSVSDTELIKISCVSNNPTEAKNIANSIVPIFTSKVKNIYKIDNVTVLDKAIESYVPSNINFVKENLIYILIGFTISSLLIFVTYYFDTTIKSSSEIEEKFHLTVLGLVPKEDNK